MITLVLGGARSGKSVFAEELAALSGDPVIYVATAVVGDDSDFAARVRVHRERRPASWTTAEPGVDLIGFLAERGECADRSVLLIESLGTWVASSPGLDPDVNGLCQALQATRATTVVVSEEVGLGVHPSTEIGGRFRDALGTVNQAVARIADRVYLVVAGRALSLPSAGELPH